MAHRSFARHAHHTSRHAGHAPATRWCLPPPQALQATSAPAVLTAQETVTAPIGRFNTVPAVRDMHRGIRERLCREHVAGGLVFSAAGGLVKRNGSDVYYRFRPNSNYFYLTGCEEPDSAVLLDTETGHTTLLVPRQAPDAAFWSGPQPSLDDLAEQYGMDRVAYSSDLPALLKQGQQVHVAGEHDLHQLQRLLGRRTTHASSSEDSGSDGESDGLGPRILDSVLSPVLNRLRSVKTDGEVACLLQANRVSGAAHVATWRACTPGTTEYQLESVFTSTCMHQGLHSLGYPCIVGAGRNAAILHYESNRSQVGPEDLVLIDAGAEFRCYTADITRTFPGGGQYTPQQLDIYQTVLDCQELALSALGEGVVFKEVDTAVRRLMVARLQELGIVKKAASVEAVLAAEIDRVFLPHGLGHHLGLDVHDVSDTGPVPKNPLQPGHVITVEPGCYFIDTLLARAAKNPDQSALLCWDVLDDFKSVGGVRIEDNVVVLGPRESGAPLFNLTMAAQVPKQAKEIEDIMAGN